MTAITDESERIATGVSGGAGQDARKAASAAATAADIARATEALKEAARAGVADRCARIEDRSMFGCVDWYLYPEERRADPHVGS